MLGYEIQTADQCITSLTLWSWAN